jgi:ankyrin repeat protein
MPMKTLLLAVALACAVLPARGQIPPDAAELAAYAGLHRAAAVGDLAALARLLDGGAAINARDGRQRTPLHVAGHLRQYAVARELLRRGADANAVEHQRYDLVTIAAVANDGEMLAIALAGGNRATNITSLYDGTALIAAAHLGHMEPVRQLIAAGAPLDHVANLGWTALIESIVLGDGGPRHTEVLRLLLAAGANPNIADRNGATPLMMARGRGYVAMQKLLIDAGATETALPRR